MVTMTTTRHRIALIPGDGIGTEVLPPACAVLDAVGKRHGLAFSYDSFDWSCERYLAEGAMMPTDGLDRIRHHDAVLLGAVGWPGWRTMSPSGDCSSPSAASSAST